MEWRTISFFAKHDMRLANNEKDRDVQTCETAFTFVEELQPERLLVRCWEVASDGATALTQPLPDRPDVADGSQLPGLHSSPMSR